MEERIKTRIAELVEARAAYAAETSRQLLGFDAAIGELRALLEPEGWRPTVNEAQERPGAEAPGTRQHHR
jgi:hypothetical protein